MTALDANPDDTSEAPVPEAPAPVVGPMAGDPAMLGLGSFIVGSVALGLAIVGVVPAGVLGAPLAIILAATALGLILAAIWAAAVGQSAVAAIFGIFGTFWLSYAVLVVSLDHNWFVITVTAVLATVRLFLISWLVVILMLTLATLRLPAAFSVLFAPGLPGAAVPAARLGGDIAAWRALERPAEDRRLHRADLRRARGIPLLRRLRGGHRRQGAPPRQAADALRTGQDLYPERAVVTAPVSCEPPWPVGV